MHLGFTDPEEQKKNRRRYLADDKEVKQAEEKYSACFLYILANNWQE